MANLYQKAFGMKNPFIIASSPATHGMTGVLKSAQAQPGAIVMRNYGHGAGGGSEIHPSEVNMLRGMDCVQSHALATPLPDKYLTFEDYLEDVKRTRDALDPSIKLWVSVGYFWDIGGECDWRKKWVDEAVAYEKAGVDAVEMHLNSPGIAYLGDNNEGYLNIVAEGVKLVSKAVSIPVMCKLPLEGVNPFAAMKLAAENGAYAVGPTARWKGMIMGEDYLDASTDAGAGYGLSQSLPIICYVTAKAKADGFKTPMFSGGGVYNAEAAAKLILAGSEIVQLGSLACCCGPNAVRKVIEDFEKLMDSRGYADLESMTGQAAFMADQKQSKSRERALALGNAYKARCVDEALCVGCGRCVDACWYDGITMNGKKAEKTNKCVGCGYCFSVCPTGALKIDKKEALKGIFDRGAQK